MNLTVETQVGKKPSIYLPKAAVNALDLKEGIKAVRHVAGKVHIYVVKPDEADKTIVSESPRALLKA